MKKKIVNTYKKYFATIKKTLKYLIKCKVYKYANSFLVLYNYHYLSSKFIMFTPLQMLSLQKKSLPYFIYYKCYHLFIKK